MQIVLKKKFKLKITIKKRGLNESESSIKIHKESRRIDSIENLERKRRKIQFARYFFREFLLFPQS